MTAIDTLIRQGCELSAEGKHREAHEVFIRACDTAPESIPAWCNRGNTAFLLNDVEDSEKAYEQALSLNAMNPIAHIGLARVAMMKKNWHDVIRRLEALASDAHRDRNYMLGIAFEQGGETDKAEEAYKAAVESGHKHAFQALLRLYMTSDQALKLADMINRSDKPDYHVITALFHGLATAKSRWILLNACSDAIRDTITVYDIAAGTFLLKKEYAYAARTYRAASGLFSAPDIKRTSSLKDCAWC